MASKIFGGAKDLKLACFVVILNILVNFLLLLSTAGICDVPIRYLRAGGASLIAGFYSLMCMIPVLKFFTGGFWHATCMLFVVLAAFGFRLLILRQLSIFVLLNMSLLGMVSDGGNFGVRILVTACLVCLVVLLCFRKFGRFGSLIPVELTYQGKKIKFKALRDTGNMLCDPLTGMPVLVVGQDVAQKITGFTKQQLLKPTEILQTSGVQGLRLLSYATIGQKGGLMLALKIPDVKIGHLKGSRLVAFAPEVICEDGKYQALIGGNAI